MHKKLSLKENLQSMSLTIGSWLSLSNTAVAEIMAGGGFDWLAIDIEHTPTTLQETQQLIRVIELAGVTPLVRVSENNATIIKRVMDAGAHGVIVPLVNTVEEARNAVNAVLYPPLGTRGVGLWRAQGYGRTFRRYVEWQNQYSVVVAQIEHIRGVENLEAILAVDGIDALFIGPYDLSASLGAPGQFDNPKYIEAVEHVEAVARAMNKPAGCHVVYPDSGEVRKKIEAGYTFIAVGTDYLFLIQNIDQLMLEIRNHISDKSTILTPEHQGET